MPAKPPTYLSKKAAFVLSLMGSHTDVVVLGGNPIEGSKPYQLGDSLAGYGYSVDSQKLVDEQCYNATPGLPEGTNSVVSLNEATSFSDFESKLSYSVKAGLGFGIFSAQSDASYMRQVSDKDYTLSLNYFSYSSGTVRVQTAIGQDALTDAGKQEYSNNLTNPYFGVVCGDEIVTSYQQGALLAMALNIEFQSHMDKEQFQASASTGFGSIFTASATVESIASHYEMDGRVSLTAYQQGGEPGQLSKILSKDPSGNFYINSCSITNMTACRNAASGLLNYASADFPNQFSVSAGLNLTTLGFGLYDTQPIQYIGLMPPKSLLDNATLNARLSVANTYSQQLCYQDKFYSLFHGYPVSWDTSSPFYHQMGATRNDVKSNIDVILGDQPSGKGLPDCYLTPDQCMGIIQAIQSGIQPVDFSFLQLLRYYFRGHHAAFYYDGSSWGFKNYPGSKVSALTDENFHDTTNISYATVDAGCDCGLFTAGIFTNGRLQADNITISGRWTCYQDIDQCGANRNIKRPISSFFFDELARCDGTNIAVIERDESMGLAV